MIGAYYLRKFKDNPDLLESIKSDLISFVSEVGGTAKDQNLVVLKELLNIEDPTISLLHRLQNRQY